MSGWSGETYGRGEVPTGGFSGLRKRNKPRPRTGVLRVRERFEAVEIPLKRTKKSRNARKKPFFAESISNRSGQAGQSAPLLDGKRGLPVAVYSRACSPKAGRHHLGLGIGLPGVFLPGLEMPMLMRRNLRPLRSVSSMLMVSSFSYNGRGIPVHWR